MAINTYNTNRNLNCLYNRHWWLRWFMITKRLYYCHCHHCPFGSSAQRGFAMCWCVVCSGCKGIERFSFYGRAGMVIKMAFLVVVVNHLELLCLLLASNLFGFKLRLLWSAKCIHSIHLLHDAQVKENACEFCWRLAFVQFDLVVCFSRQLFRRYMPYKSQRNIGSNANLLR